MRGMSKPCVVDLISKADDVFGDVVPIPALPVDGNIFWACAFAVTKNAINSERYFDFIKTVLLMMIYYFASTVPQVCGMSQ